METEHLQEVDRESASDPGQPVPTANQPGAADGRVVASVLFAVALLLLSVLLPWASDKDSVEWTVFGQQTGFEAAAKIFLWGMNVEVTPVGASGTAESRSISWFDPELNDEDGTGRLTMIRSGVVLFGLGAIFAMATLVGALQPRGLSPVLPVVAASLLGLGVLLFVLEILDDGGPTLWGTWLAAFIAVITLGVTAFLASHGGRRSMGHTVPNESEPER